MCTAYELGKRGGSFPSRVNAKAAKHLMNLDDTRIIRPTISAPVIMPNGDLKEMIWGFRRQVPAVKTKLTWRTIVNSREDKLKGRTWARAFQDRRCLVPAAAFYEWVQSPGGMAPLRFDDPGGGFLWIAGIWEHDPERGECFSMITTEPNELVGPVHDRMPAVLLPDQIDPFLDGDLQEFGPSRGILQFAEAPNFLKQKKAAKASSNPILPPDQGELF